MAGWLVASLLCWLFGWLFGSVFGCPLRSLYCDLMCMKLYSFLGILMIVLTCAVFLILLSVLFPAIRLLGKVIMKSASVLLMMLT